MTEPLAPARPSSARTSPVKLVVAIALGCVVNPLNATMIASAFGEIASGFGVGLTDASWLVTLYLALTAALQAVCGAVGDRIGRRRAFLAGVAAFGVASAGAAMAPSLPSLIAFRCLQAASSALAVPNGIAMLRDGVPPEMLGRASGGLGALMGIGAAIGLPLGSQLVERAGWQAIFWVNVPIVVVALFVAVAWLPPVAPTRANVSPVAILGGSLLPFAVGIELSHRSGRGAASAAMLVAAAVILLAGAAFVVRSSVAKADVRLLATAPLIGATAFIAFQQLVFFTALLMLPTWLTSALDLPPGRAGMYVGVTTLLMVLLAPASGRLADATGVRGPAVSGAVLTAAAIAVLGASSEGLSFAQALAGLLLLGLGFGISGPAVQRAALDAAPSEVAGLAMGIFTSARYFGGIVGAALLSASLAERSVTVDLVHGAAVFRKVELWGALPGVAAALLLGGRAAKPKSG